MAEPELERRTRNGWRLASGDIIRMGTMLAIVIIWGVQLDGKVTNLADKLEDHGRKRAHEGQAQDTQEIKANQARISQQIIDLKNSDSSVLRAILEELRDINSTLERNQGIHRQGALGAGK